jgi:TonB family protein
VPLTALSAATVWLETSLAGPAAGTAGDAPASTIVTAPHVSVRARASSLHRRGRALAEPRALAAVAPPAATAAKPAAASAEAAFAAGSAQTPADESLARVASQSSVPAAAQIGAAGAVAHAGEGAGSAIPAVDAVPGTNGLGASGGAAHGPGLLAFDSPCAGYFPARANADHGEVQLSIDVDARGQTRASTVLIEQPRNQGFGIAARACARQLHFAPAITDSGAAVPGHAKLKLRFDRRSAR